MLTKKVLTLTLISSLISLQAEGPKAVANKIAFANFNQFINLQNVKDNLEEFNDKHAKIQEEVQKKEVDLRKLDQELAKGVEALENMRKSGIGTEETIKKKTEELMRKQQELQMGVKASQDFYQSSLQTVFEDLKTKGKAIIEKIKKADGWDTVIINFGAFELVTDPVYDLTSRVKAELNADYAKQKKSDDAKKAATKK